MNKWLTYALLFFAISTNAQNEFAATAFYTDFKKIYDDSQSGFITYKGDKRNSEYEELQSEYNVKLLLPLADSGKIVIPATGNPYVVYYFEPAKSRLKIDQRAVDLREAIMTAYNQPLFIRTETNIVDNRPYSNSWFFTDINEASSSKALFRMNIYYKDDKYYLLFEIRKKSS